MFGRAIVKKKRGGASGGATELTEFGISLIEAWERCRREVGSCMNEAFEEFIKPIIGGSEHER
jgi:molybdate transport repressor ModE-like protein